MAKPLRVRFGDYELDEARNELRRGKPRVELQGVSSLCAFVSVVLSTCLGFASQVRASDEGVIPLEHFFESPQLQQPRLSPDGRHIAAIAPDDEGPRIVVLDTDTTQLATGPIAFPGRQIYRFKDRIVHLLPDDSKHVPSPAGCQEPVDPDRGRGRDPDHGDEI